MCWWGIFFSVGLRRRLKYDLFPIIIWQKMIIWQLNRGRPTRKSWIIRLASNLNWHSFLRQNFDIRLPALDSHLFSSEIQNWLQICCTTTSMRTMWDGELGLLQVREDIKSKKTFSFGHCPNDGRGSLPMPEFFGPLFRSAFLVNKKSLFLQKCLCIELLTVF